MQIRVQGRKIQCIRSAYDPETKRSRQRVVATLDSYAVKMPSSGLDNLTDAERAQLSDYLAPRAAEREESTLQYTLETLDRGVERLADAVERGGEDRLQAEVAERTWAAIARLQKSLKKAGHPKPTPPAKRPAKPVLEGQGDLL